MHPSIGPMCLESDVPSLCLVFKSCHWGSWRWLVEISDLLKLAWVIIYFCTFLYLLYVFCSSYRKGNIQWMCLSRGNPGLTIPVHIFEMLGFCRAHPQGERLHQIWYIIVNYNIICYVYLYIYIYMTIIMIVCLIYYVDICVWYFRIFPFERPFKKSSESRASLAANGDGAARLPEGQSPSSQVHPCFVHPCTLVTLVSLNITRPL